MEFKVGDRVIHKLHWLGDKQVKKKAIIKELSTNHVYIDHTPRWYRVDSIRVGRIRFY